MAAPEAPSSLDIATHTGSGWSASVFQRSGEATVCWVTASSGAGDPERETDEERSRQEACRRARSVLRRYCTAHALTRLITLTFAVEPADLDEGWAAVEDFRRRLAVRLGRRIPMAVVPEWGERNGRLHFHCAVGQYIDYRVLRRLWGLGMVDIRRLGRRKDGESRGAREQARVAASYVAEYVAKGSGEHDRRAPGRKRYSTTKGTKVEPRRVRFATLAGAMRFLEVVMAGQPVVSEWRSASVEGWRGPPCYLWLYGDG